MEGAEDLPGEGAKDDEDGFEEESEGESAEGTEIDFGRTVSAGAGGGAEWVDARLGGEARNVDRRLDDVYGH